MRRLIARLGASATAREVPPPAATARAMAPVRPAVAAPPTAVAAAVRAAGPPGTRAVAVPRPPLAPTARAAAAALPAPAARHVAAAVATRRRRARPLRRAAVHRGVPAAARVARRPRTPWTLLGRARLAAAWEAVSAGRSPADLRLLGVYGPLPLGAVTGAVLEPDGRLRVALGGRRPGPTGDVALARDLETGRLVRADVPYPGSGSARRRLR